MAMVMTAGAMRVAVPAGPACGKGDAVSGRGTACRGRDPGWERRGSG
jgi:hypothetical protein